jgi:hypothetical protein
LSSLAFYAMAWRVPVVSQHLIILLSFNAD